MDAKESSFIPKLLSDSEIDKIADSVADKLMQVILGLNTVITTEQEELPIKMRDVCKLLDISDTTVRTWMTKGALPYHRKGGRVYFFKSEVLQSFNNSKKN